jgi:hypothetical protein
MNKVDHLFKNHKIQHDKMEIQIHETIFLKTKIEIDDKILEMD